jgi:HEAT repeat protein
LTQDCRSIIKAGHQGDEHTVRAGLVSSRADVRAVALGAAQRLGVLTTDDLLAGLNDPEPAVQRRAIEESARRPPPNAPPALVARLVAALDEEPLAEVAAFALGELDYRDADDLAERVTVALSHTATNHPDALCRESAVAALGAIGQGLPAILAAMQDIATVRRRAVLALSPFDGPEVDAALHAALDDRDRQVRQAAEDLLGPAPD